MYQVSGLRFWRAVRVRAAMAALGCFVMLVGISESGARASQINPIAEARLSFFSKGIKVLDQRENVYSHFIRCERLGLFFSERVPGRIGESGGSIEWRFATRMQDHFCRINAGIHRWKESIGRKRIRHRETSRADLKIIGWGLTGISYLKNYDGNMSEQKIVELNSLEPHIGPQLSFGGLSGMIYGSFRRFSSFFSRFNGAQRIRLLIVNALSHSSSFSEQTGRFVGQNPGKEDQQNISDLQFIKQARQPAKNHFGRALLFITTYPA